MYFIRQCFLKFLQTKYATTRNNTQPETYGKVKLLMKTDFQQAEVQTQWEKEDKETSKCQWVGEADPINLKL